MSLAARINSIEKMVASREPGPALREAAKLAMSMRATLAEIEALERAEVTPEEAGGTYGRTPEALSCFA